MRALATRLVRESGELSLPLPRPLPPPSGFAWGAAASDEEREVLRVELGLVNRRIRSRRFNRPAPPENEPVGAATAGRENFFLSAVCRLTCGEDLPRRSGFEILRSCGARSWERLPRCCEIELLSERELGGEPEVTEDEEKDPEEHVSAASSPVCIIRISCSSDSKLWGRKEQIRNFRTGVHCVGRLA